MALAMQAVSAAFCAAPASKTSRGAHAASPMIRPAQLRCPGRKRSGAGAQGPFPASPGQPFTFTWMGKQPVWCAAALRARRSCARLALAPCRHATSLRLRGLSEPYRCCPRLPAAVVATASSAPELEPAPTAPLDRQLPEADERFGVGGQPRSPSAACLAGCRLCQASASSLHCSVAASRRIRSSPSQPGNHPRRMQGLKVLVAGATGGVGKAVVQQLVAQGVPVKALVRDGVKAAGMLPPASRGVEIVEGDVYKFGTIAKAMAGW